jgi:hypothetical protein
MMGRNGGILRTPERLLKLFRITVYVHSPFVTPYVTSLANLTILSPPATHVSATVYPGRCSGVAQMD